MLDDCVGSRGATVRLLIELGLNGDGADGVVAEYLLEKSESSGKGFVLERAAKILKEEDSLDNGQEALNL